MKNFIKSICLLMLFGVGSVFGITAQKTFKVYNNDGSMSVFFYSALDSITFTSIGDMDGSLIQNIHTTDSIYSFRTCDIDSVSFSTVPTIFKPTVTRIEGAFRDYVVGSESLTLLLKATVPKSILPKIGEDIVTLDCNDALPNGFIGKVEDIIFDSDYVRIVCGKASLLDVFESLSIEESFTSEESDVETNTRSPLDIWPAKHFDLVIPSIRGEISLSHEDGMGLNFSSSYDMTAFAELSTEKCDLNIAFFITPMAFQTPQVYLSLSYYAKNTFSIGSSMCASFKWDKEMSVLPINKIKIPGPVGALLDFFIDGGAYLGFEGKLGVNGQFNKPYTTVMQYTYDNKAETTISPVFKMIGGKGESETTLEGDASVSIGLYGKIGVSPILKDMAEIDAGFKTGITISTATELPTEVPSIDEINTEIYDTLDKDDYFRVDFFLTGDFSAEMLDSKILDYKLEIGDFILANPVFTKGIVPHFSDVGLSKGDNSNSLLAKAQVSRSLMFNTDVGLALYDEDNHLVDKWWSPVEYKDNEGEIISYCFEGLSPYASYRLHPITRLFKDNLVANPWARYNLKPNIITRESKNIMSSQATLCAQIELEDDVEYIAGFYYFCGDDERKEISIDGRGAQTLELTVRDLIEYMEYTYLAFIKINGHIEYGEKKTFCTYGLGDGIVIYADKTLWDIGSTNAMVGFNYRVESNGYKPYIFGTYYYEDGGEPNYFDEVNAYGPDGRVFMINGLKPDTRYTCISYVKVDGSMIYGEPQVFRTLRENDEEEPIFKFTQIEVSRGYELNTIHEFDVVNAETAEKYILQPSECFLNIPRSCERYFDNLKLGYHLENDWNTNYYDPHFDYEKFVATGNKKFVVKYAIATNPEEWYYTKVPIELYYDTPPKILSYDHENYSREPGVNFELQGSFWISNIIVEAELWDRVPYKDEYSNTVIDVLVEERTFELSPKDTWNNHFGDGSNFVVLYPKGSNNCISPHVKIKNITLVPKQ